ncbi:calcium-transporting ATPase 1 [Oxobacter pfennigii]|uniref:P-type Ca(2+) transporter n=1 Tax=Oxobacter pfennigii TaxID=36849 RepID=A0A0P8W598_9CLOT|nr:calcium-translocating P-type ATPase, SERCA-type [Oxobacter pfennigii]KPU43796.1 calcium-transporting ATPase 1 [Oxobacter pfennigii]
MLQHWYNKTAQDAAKKLSVDLSTGLSLNKVQELIEKHGYNELKEKEKETLLQKIITQLKDFLVIILIAASLVSAFVGEVTDAAVIIAIVVVNAVLGVMQEGKAEKALEALKKMSAPNARAFRNGRIEIVPAKMLVPGDIIHIEAGDIIPADIRILESVNLKVEEASLTGESVPVEKHADRVFNEEVGLGDRVNMAYMSTVVTYGRGRGIVVDTANKTEIGKIADKIQDIEDEETPLQKKLDELGKWLGIACLGICAVVFLIGLLRGGSILEMFMVAVSLAVAAIPEGLPAVVTIVLALGMKRMVERNAVVRKLLAVETLGCVDVICSDKTGTLTQNEMTVVGTYSPSGKFKVTGQGYNPTGEFSNENGEIINLSDNPEFKLLLDIGVLCNDSSLMKKEEGDQYGIVGDPTEAALVVAGAKAGCAKDDLSCQYPRIAEIPFDSDRKMMTTFHENYCRGVVSFTKGAPDIILGKCSKIYMEGQIVPLMDEMRQDIHTANSKFASSALRVLAFAYREYDSLPSDISSESIEKDMVFVGLMGMIDPARTEAKDAIAICRRAGIKPVMITGDYKDTAVAIAKDLKLMDEDDGVLTGQELDNMSDDELLREVETTSVYARVSPEHKVRIVDALKKNGHIASMTGDGVNDAMALKRADIGVAMGITGTDVAKGTADIVLTDDNFASIVSAVEEGRIIYSNIRKFVFFLLSCNVGEILIVFLSILLGLPVPLIPIQLLWLNLVTDSFPALALGTEKGDPDIMNMRPRNAKEPILNKSMITGIAVQSVALVAAVLGAYLVALNRYPDYLVNAEHLMYARTYAFTTLISAELIRAYSSRSERFTIFKIGVFSNRILVYASILSFALLAAVIYIPVLRPVFETVSLNINDWGVILMFCFVPFLSGEIYKVVRRNVLKQE